MSARPVSVWIVPGLPVPVVPSYERPTGVMTGPIWRRGRDRRGKREGIAISYD